LRLALGPLVELIEKLTGEIRAYDKKIEALCKHYPAAELLMSTPSIGPITAMAFLLTLEFPERFENSRNVPAHLGLTPRRDQSGDTDKQLRITKAGNAFLRRLLICAAQYTLGPFCKDSELRRWGLRLAERGGKNAKKRAVVAVARKLAVLLHRLWLNGMLYEPFPNTASEGPVSDSSTDTQTVAIPSSPAYG
jgi:transposase